MRQAGRYQAEYRRIRERVGFLELCKSPDLAAEVTVFAAEQLRVDAAIIFADILLIVEPLGFLLEFCEGRGPVIHNPIRKASDLSRVNDDHDTAKCLGYVGQAIQRTCAALPPGVPLIGFAAAPFTLASYLIEGGATRNFAESKAMMRSEESAWNRLMQKLVRSTAAYLNMQVDAGAQALQVFDSWVGCLSEVDYLRYVAPHMRELFGSLPAEVPVIHFGSGNGALYPAMAAAASTAPAALQVRKPPILAVDWRVDIAALRPKLPPACVLMGNLDPTALLASEEALLRETDRVLAEIGTEHAHIFNLGHGILPTTPVPHAQRLVEHVHAATQIAS